MEHCNVKIATEAIHSQQEKQTDEFEAEFMSAAPEK
jgi:hypothetical protein